MTGGLNKKAPLETLMRGSRWRRFAALGVGELILGAIASLNLMTSNLASVLLIGAAVFVAGIFQVIRAFSEHDFGAVLLWLVAGLVYAVAGAIVLCNPGFETLTLSRATGIFLLTAGIMRAWAGFHARPASGWGWVAATGVLTLCVGFMVVALWPAIGLVFLGAMLVVDLMFQGWGLYAFAAALSHRSLGQAHGPAG
jgi:uncharacterized membrane protein HdeD (DUF308 family)